MELCWEDWVVKLKTHTVRSFFFSAQKAKLPFAIITTLSKLLPPTMSLAFISLWPPKLCNTDTLSNLYQFFLLLLLFERTKTWSLMLENHWQASKSTAPKQSQISLLLNLITWPPKTSQQVPWKPEISTFPFAVKPLLSSFR